MRVLEALRALLGHRDAGEALDLDDVALALELLAEVDAGLVADAVVVAGDQGAVCAGLGELAVDVDDRDAGLHRLQRHRCEGVALVRQHDERVGLGRDQGLDLVGLGGRVGHALGQLERDALELVRLLAGVLGDGGHPAVVGTRRAERDGDRLRLGGLPFFWSTVLVLPPDSSSDPQATNPSARAAHRGTTRRFINIGYSSSGRWDG